MHVGATSSTLADATTTHLDSHADCCVVGSNALIIHDFERPVDISGYDPNGPVTKSLRTVSAAVAYTIPTSGAVVMLVIHQAVFVPSLHHNLLCPNQMRLNDVVVNEQPKFLTEQPSESTHAIMIPGNDEENLPPLTIPLDLKGLTSCFPTRLPSIEEYESCIHYELTAEEPFFDPHDPSYANQELACVDHRGHVITIGDEEVQCKDRNRNWHFSGIVLPYPTRQESESQQLYKSLAEKVMVATVATKASRPGIDAMTLAKNWGIGIEKAERTLRATSQRGIRTVLHPSLSRRFRTNDRQLRYRRLPIKVFTDTMKANEVSNRGNRYVQVYCTPEGWTRAFPMKKKSEAHETLSLLFSRDGVPNVMIMDGAREQVMGEFRKKCRQASLHVRQTEPHTPFSNAAESAIRELKKGVARQMVRAKAPKVLWDHCVEREALIRSNTAHPIYELNGQVPETLVSGETPDITTIAEFQWYEWVKFRDTAISFPDDPIILGRDLGPAIDIGPAYTRKVLKANGQVIYRSTVRALTPDEMKDPEEIKAREDFDASILDKLGEATTWEDLEDDRELDTPVLPSYKDSSGGANTYMADEDDVYSATPDTIDKYVGAEVLLPTGDGTGKGRVCGRKRNQEGNPIGRAHKNPVIDTRVYSVEFDDGRIGDYAANVIAEHMLSTVDEDGNMTPLLAAIVGHRTNGHAVERADMYVNRAGHKALRRTTKGWQLCVEWRSGDTSWLRLADLKESHPIEVAEYAVIHGLQEEPAFAWWVPQTLSDRNRIIAAVKRRVVSKKSEKFGIRIPRTWEEAVKIDKENGDTLWQDAIRAEMAKVRVAFKIVDDDYIIPPGYQVIRCHLIFDLKIEDFRRKARLVAGGHMTKAPASLTYSSVVSRESVRIALTLASLNALQVMSSDIENAYLTAPAAEKIWTILGHEFGEDAGKRAIIVRSLYGLKSAGAAFRNHLADCMRHLGWTSCLADPDVWIKAEVRPSDGFKYYAYALLYVDDALIVHHDAETALREMDHYFKMKPGSIKTPDFYLGAKLRQMTLPNGVCAWGMSASKYIQGAVMNLKKYLKTSGELSLPKRAATPFPQGYRPEIDVTPELPPAKVTDYQSLIGILRWCVELGRVDIITEVSMLASHLALPREGHLEVAIHIFAYLDKKHNSRIVFDPSYPPIDHSKFKECDWSAFYGDAKEAIPPNAPQPRGKEVDLRLFVDSDHAGDQAIRRSRTGFFVFLNMAPIVWYSKRQPTVESSVFGAEFVAMKNGMETVRGLRYKLRMMGVPLSGPTLMYGDNMSVIHNTQRPESTLTKKSNSICYHAIREAVAMGECLTAHVPTDQNPADICTKVLPGGRKRDHLISLVLYDLCDEH